MEDVLGLELTEDGFQTGGVGDIRNDGRGIDIAPAIL